MAESAAFEAARTSLEESSPLDRLAARGTVRLALKQAGLEPKSVTAREPMVVAKRLLPAELRSRGRRPSAGRTDGSAPTTCRGRAHGAVVSMPP